MQSPTSYHEGVDSDLAAGLSMRSAGVEPLLPAVQHAPEAIQLGRHTFPQDIVHRALHLQVVHRDTALLPDAVSAVLRLVACRCIRSTSKP
jgi:hypothetical protein